MELCKKPQKPLQQGENYFYPLTSIDQVVVEEDSIITRLPAKFDKYYTKKEIDDKLKNFSPSQPGGGDSPNPDWGGGGIAPSGTGDMKKSIYDPQNKSTDIFKYADEASKKNNPNMILGFKDSGEGSLIGNNINADTLGGHFASDFIRASQIETLLSKYIPSIKNNSGSHNSIFRGSFLGNFISDEQGKAIKDGSFDNLFLGDYWKVQETYYIIIGFDWKNIKTEGSMKKVSHLNILSTKFLNGSFQKNQIQGLIDGEFLKTQIPLVPDSSYKAVNLTFFKTNKIQNQFSNVGIKGTLLSSWEIFGFNPFYGTDANVCTAQFPFFRYVTLQSFLNLFYNFKKQSVWTKEVINNINYAQTNLSFNNEFGFVEEDSSDSLPFLYHFCLTVV